MQHVTVRCPESTRVVEVHQIFASRCRPVICGCTAAPPDAPSHRNLTFQAFRACFTQHLASSQSFTTKQSTFARLDAFFSAFTSPCPPFALVATRAQYSHKVESSHRLSLFTLPDNASEARNHPHHHNVRIIEPIIEHLRKGLNGVTLFRLQLAADVVPR